MARKKKTVKTGIDEVAQLVAEETLTDTDTWPKIIQGSHLTITEHENGKVDMTWDWDQLNKDINNAINKEQPTSIGGVTNQESPKTGGSKRKISSTKKGKKDEVV